MCSERVLVRLKNIDCGDLDFICVTIVLFTKLFKSINYFLFSVLVTKTCFFFNVEWVAGFTNLTNE